MDKSPDAFRTISEVAEHLETPAHVLRFWESRFPQIKPVKRAGGRRYYRPSDVALLTGIKRLLHDEGMTIRGVQKILREQGVRHVAGLSGDVIEDEANIEADYVAAVQEPPVMSRVVQLKSEPVPIRPMAELTPGVGPAQTPSMAPSLMPGLADAMARAVDQRPSSSRSVAPSTPLPMDEPAQGALLLTPPSAAPQTPAIEGDSAVQAGADSTADLDIATFVKAERERTGLPDGVPTAGPEVPWPEGALAGAAGGNGSIADDPGTDESANKDSAADEPSAGDDLGFDAFGEDDLEDGPTATLASRIRALPDQAVGGRVGADLLGVVARLQALRDAVATAARDDRG